MDRLVTVLDLGNAHSNALNREPSIVRSDRLSCPTYPRQNIIHLKGRRLELDVDLDIRLPDFQEVSRALEPLSPGCNGVRRTALGLGFAEELKAAAINKGANISAPETAEAGLWLQGATTPQAPKFCLYPYADLIVLPR